MWIPCDDQHVFKQRVQRYEAGVMLGPVVMRELSDVFKDCVSRAKYNPHKFGSGAKHIPQLLSPKGPFIFPTFSAVGPSVFPT